MPRPGPRPPTLDPIVEQLRALRLHLGLTQSWVANRCGTTQSAVSDSETGDSVPTLTTLRKWTAAFGLTLRLDADEQIRRRE